MTHEKHTSCLANARRQQDDGVLNVLLEPQKENGGKGRARHLERDERMTGVSDYHILWQRSVRKPRICKKQIYQVKGTATWFDGERRERN